MTMTDEYYRTYRALSNDDTMMPALCHPRPRRSGVQSGLITPPHTPPTICDMDLDDPTQCIEIDASSPSRPPALGLHADAFPHIIDLIFQYAPNASLATLRTVCRSWRDKGDALLLQHIVLQDECAVALPSGGPVRADWLSTPLSGSVRVLDVVDLNLDSPTAFPSRVHILRAHSIERWHPDSIFSMPHSDTLVLHSRISDGSYGPDSANWAPYISRTRRLVAHYSASTPELGAWGAVGAALALPSCPVRNVTFIFSGEADDIHVSLLGALLMLTMQLGWHRDTQIDMAEGRLEPIVLVNALPWFAAGIDRGEALAGDSQGDIVALFLRAAGFGRGINSDDELKARYARYFKFMGFSDYRRQVGDEQFELEMERPRRVGTKPYTAESGHGVRCVRRCDGRRPIERL